MSCLFCRIVDGEIPATVVHETKTTLAFRDIRPKAPVHVLLIPREHVPNAVDLDRDQLGDLFAAAKEVAEAEGVSESGYRLVFNTGPDSGQEVFHAHLHVLGGERL
ncbi:histidine triad nucleotide-binding protein [Lentzea sp. PSKA42]|uniref:Histidine triad nucleotide-binding protein n=1 Tax=Lentzea indica TaxID=2604800 RepID=A0ABX1FYL9_9PSEU|nr:histidine triad nucleotide-binding protein [Lentzea indica]NKE63448.1 histidine triad nucleotide-binding protein [Lentzea indica]